VQTNVCRMAKEAHDVDVTRGEIVEAGLGRPIERRSRRKDPDEESQPWRGSARRYSARGEAELRAAWCEFRVGLHVGQAARLRANPEAPAGYHEREARKYGPEGAR
jgi:hypothetical protein